MKSMKHILWPAVLLMATSSVGFAQNKTTDNYKQDKYVSCRRDKDYGKKYDHDRDKHDHDCDKYGRDHDEYGRDHDKYGRGEERRDYREVSQDSAEQSYGR
jgi:hypothetical protein